MKNDKLESMKVTNCPGSVDRDRKNFKNTNNIFRRKKRLPNKKKLLNFSEKATRVAKG